MARHRYRGRRSQWGSTWLYTTAAVATVSVWWLYGRSDAPAEVEATLALATQPALTTDRPEVVRNDPPPVGVVEKGAAPKTAGGNTPTNQAIEPGR